MTDDDGAVCRSAVQLVSVETTQCFALIRKLSNAILPIATIVKRVDLQLVPLNTQRQHNAIMTLQCFLTFVGGAGVPHLSKEKKKGSTQTSNENDLVCVWQYFISKRFQAFVEATLMVLSEDPEKSRSPVE